MEHDTIANPGPYIPTCVLCKKAIRHERQAIKNTTPPVMKNPITIANIMSTVLLHLFSKENTQKLTIVWCGSFLLLPLSNQNYSKPMEMQCRQPFYPTYSPLGLLHHSKTHNYIHTNTELTPTSHRQPPIKPILTNYTTVYPQISHQLLLTNLSPLYPIVQGPCDFDSY